ncbi:uncharacterized protein LOC126232467 [Schistocerca nitens]|uniref:uncharacterized protein LOC126232467 n=1 Tax=Schistocerca nitens TaxID=7011 RepID=UPI00211751D9|nr:uncharacterized protein LOC126232467 [Schistocerca nitens]
MGGARKEKGDAEAFKDGEGASEAVRGSGNACLAAGTASKCGWMGGHSTAPVPKEATLAAGPPRMRPAGGCRQRRHGEASKKEGRTRAAAFALRRLARFAAGAFGGNGRDKQRCMVVCGADRGGGGGGLGGGEAAPTVACAEAVRGSGNACLAAGTASKCGWMGGHSTAPVPKEATLAAGPPRMRPAGGCVQDVEVTTEQKIANYRQMPSYTASTVEKTGMQRPTEAAGRTRKQQKLTEEKTNNTSKDKQAISNRYDQQRCQHQQRHNKEGEEEHGATLTHKDLKQQQATNNKV